MPARRTKASSPLGTTTIRTVPSSPAQAMRRPSRLNTTEVTRRTCPLRQIPHRHVSTTPADEMLPVRAEGQAIKALGVSLQGVDFSAASSIPQLDLAGNHVLIDEFTAGPGEERIARMKSNALNRTVWSQRALRRCSPSGLNATRATILRCPWQVKIAWPVSESQIRVAPWSSAEANPRPLGRKLCPTAP